MQESESRYQKLVETSPQAITVHAQGKFVFANAAAAPIDKEIPAAC